MPTFIFVITLMAHRPQLHTQPHFARGILNLDAVSAVNIAIIESDSPLWEFSSEWSRIELINGDSYVIPLSVHAALQLFQDGPSATNTCMDYLYPAAVRNSLASHTTDLCERAVIVQGMSINTTGAEA